MTERTVTATDADGRIRLVSGIHAVRPVQVEDLTAGTVLSEPTYTVPGSRTRYLEVFDHFAGPTEHPEPAMRPDEDHVVIVTAEGHHHRVRRGTMVFTPAGEWDAPPLRPGGCHRCGTGQGDPYTDLCHACAPGDPELLRTTDDGAEVWRHPPGPYTPTDTIAYHFPDCGCDRGLSNLRMRTTCPSCSSRHHGWTSRLRRARLQVALEVAAMIAPPPAETGLPADVVLVHRRHDGQAAACVRVRGVTTATDGLVACRVTFPDWTTGGIDGDTRWWLVQTCTGRPLIPWDHPTRAEALQLADRLRGLADFTLPLDEFDADRIPSVARYVLTEEIRR